MSEFNDDTKLYREMSEPHPSREALNEDLQKFHEGLAELRKNCKLQNIVVIIQTPFLADGKEGLGTSLHTLGDRMQAQAMCAYGYGWLKSEIANAMAHRLAGK